MFDAEHARGLAKEVVHRFVGNHIEVGVKAAFKIDNEIAKKINPLNRPSKIQESRAPTLAFVSEQPLDRFIIVKSIIPSRVQTSPAIGPLLQLRRKFLRAPCLMDNMRNHYKLFVMRLLAGWV